MEGAPNTSLAQAARGMRDGHLQETMESGTWGPPCWRGSAQPPTTQGDTQARGLKRPCLNAGGCLTRDKYKHKHGKERVPI